MSAVEARGLVRRFGERAVLSGVDLRGELAAAVLVELPGTTTLAVRLASLLHFGEDGIVSSLCLVLAFLVLAVMGIVSLAANRILELQLDVRG